MKKERLKAKIHLEFEENDKRDGVQKLTADIRGSFKPMAIMINLIKSQSPETIKVIKDAIKLGEEVTEINNL